MPGHHIRQVETKCNPHLKRFVGQQRSFVCELVAAKKYAELEALGKQQEALQQESAKLMNVNAREEAVNVISAEEDRARWPSSG